MTLSEKDKAYVWHPFTQMKLADPPIHIERAKGCTLFSAGGKTYIDAVSSWWVNIHGHTNEVIAERIAAQAKVLEHVIFAGFTHEPAITLAEKLIAILPPHFAKVFFSDDGSTAVEVGVKMALQYWHNQGKTNKTKIIALDNAYHGDTFGAMAAGSRSTFTQPFHQHLFEVNHIPAPSTEDVDRSIVEFRKIAEQGNVAAFIFEPLVQGSSGMLMHEPKNLDRLLAVAQEYDILCIADEVMTGFGRTGKNFAISYLQHRPDIICLSKGITGGFLPLGVTVSTQKIFDAFYHNDVTKTFFHGHSYTANPLACAAANASIELLLDKNCQQQIKWITSAHQIYAGRMSTHPFVKNLRCRGTILALELNTDENTSYFNNIRKHASEFYLKNGVLLRPLGNVIYIMPPYCITKEELEKVYEVITQSLGYLQQKSKEK